MARPASLVTHPPSLLKRQSLASLCQTGNSMQRSSVFRACFVLALCRLVSCLLPDYSDHECIRQCREDSPPRVCRYRWVLEDYLTLSRACYGCPGNQSDCWRPHCVSADGVERNIKTANRALPGPTIQVCEADTVEVVVQNEMVMSEGVTIHWHGQLQRHSPHMDGVAMVTQCPIPPSSSFTYRFLAEYPGTHLWHSHAGIYRGDGLFGSMVVRQPDSRDPQRALYDFDLPEHVIVINDWAHKPAVDVFTGFYYSDKPQAPDSILINGRGKYRPQENEKNESATPFAEFHVKAGRRYRFRVVNAGSLKCPIQLSVDDHKLLLIASDGRPFKPFLVDSFISFSGERYDFVFEPKGNHSAVFWMRAQGLLQCQTNNVEQLAVVHVHAQEGLSEQLLAPRAEDKARAETGAQFNSWLLSPKTSDPGSQIAQMTSLEPDDVSLTRSPDKQYFLEFAYRFRNNTHFHDPDFYPVNGQGYKSVFSAMINNISNVLPPAPLLTQYSDIDEKTMCDVSIAGPKCEEEYCECVHRMEARQGELLEVVVYNANNVLLFTHPVHMHGYSFRVVGTGRLEQTMSEELFRDLDKQGRIPRKLHGAPFKDTVPVPDGGYVVLRLEVNNPGAWFVHCHVAFHAEIGMALTFLVSDGEGRLTSAPPDFPRCGNWPSSLDTRSTLGHQQAGSGGIATGNDELPQSAVSVTATPNWVVPAVVTLCVVVVLLLAELAREKRRHFGQGKVCATRCLSTGLSSTCAHADERLTSEDERRGLL